jgi:hypothetical protein
VTPSGTNTETPSSTWTPTETLTATASVTGTTTPSTTFSATASNTPLATSDLYLTYSENFENPSNVVPFSIALSRLVADGEGGVALSVIEADVPLFIETPVSIDAIVQVEFEFTAGAAQLWIHHTETSHYAVRLDMYGYVSLVRNSVVVASAQTTLTGAEQVVTVSALAGSIRVSVNQFEVLIFDDLSPLPRGGVTLYKEGQESDLFMVDDIQIWTTEMPQSALSAFAAMSGSPAYYLPPPAPSWYSNIFTTPSDGIVTSYTRGGIELRAIGQSGVERTIPIFDPPGWDAISEPIKVSPDGRWAVINCSRSNTGIAGSFITYGCIVPLFGSQQGIIDFNRVLPPAIIRVDNFHWNYDGSGFVYRGGGGTYTGRFNTMTGQVDTSSFALLVYIGCNHYFPVDERYSLCSAWGSGSSAISIIDTLNPSIIDRMRTVSRIGGGPVTGRWLDHDTLRIAFNYTSGAGCMPFSGNLCALYVAHVDKSPTAFEFTSFGNVLMPGVLRQPTFLNGADPLLVVEHDPIQPINYSVPMALHRQALFYLGSQPFTSVPSFTKTVISESEEFLLGYRYNFYPGQYILDTSNWQQQVNPNATVTPTLIAFDCVVITSTSVLAYVEPLDAVIQAANNEVTLTAGELLSVERRFALYDNVVRVRAVQNSQDWYWIDSGAGNVILEDGANCDNLPLETEDSYNVRIVTNFSDDMNQVQNWTLYERREIINAIDAIGQAFTTVSNVQPTNEIEVFNRVFTSTASLPPFVLFIRADIPSDAQAVVRYQYNGVEYNIAYGTVDNGTVNNGNCITYSGGSTLDRITAQIVNYPYAIICNGQLDNETDNASEPVSDVNGEASEYTIVHELGHILDYLSGDEFTAQIRSISALGSCRGVESNSLSYSIIAIRDRVHRRGTRGWGSAPEFSRFLQSPAREIPLETAADMFLNWVYRTNSGGSTTISGISRIAENAPTTGCIPLASQTPPPPNDTSWEGFRNRYPEINQSIEVAPFAWGLPGDIRFVLTQEIIDSIFLVNPEW